MGRKQEKEIRRIITLDELNGVIKRGEKSIRILERLYFIRFLYKGDKIKDACERLNITEPTGYSWLKAWNDSGLKGLEPHFSGGPKPRLDTVERAKLCRLLHEKETWTLRDARIMIKEQFKIEYSEMQVWRILKSMNMHHAKPYILDKRRPEDAEDILKKT